MDPLFTIFLDRFATDPPLTEHTRSEISQYLSVLHRKKKHILFCENDRHDYAYFVIQGAVRSYYLKDGVEVNTWFALEKDMVGSLHTYQGKPSRVTLELVEDTTLVALQVKPVKSLAQTNLQVAHFIAAIIEEHAYFLEDRLYFSQMMNSMDRYAAMLEKEPQLLQRIPLTYIASYLGISRETLSRLRGK
ncbi:MAG: Crp/Fnr family transcriptional regulator [Cyclobacteriaceae bacterium]|nr:Crp/Fnr family transcriptional regulator [Cyclobacteriaceae bacterium]UYN87269.1 MAG: Crp/Fnr family transcriptional regulator [Cyclobacteriaceae bacterium]